jgi:hypothetical protein
MSPEYRAALVARLRELAAGAEPEDHRFGICNDLKVMVYIANPTYKGNPYGLMEEWATDLGLDPRVPIPYERDSVWTGPQGETRRLFALVLADYLEGLPYSENLRKLRGFV